MRHARGQLANRGQLLGLGPAPLVDGQLLQRLAARPLQPGLARRLLQPHYAQPHQRAAQAHRERLWELLWSTGPIRLAQELAGPAAVEACRWLSLAGDSPALLVLFALARWRGSRLESYRLLALFLAAGIINFALWELIGLPRPRGPDITVHADEPVSSFPSGHTVMALVLWGGAAGQGRVPRAVPWLLVPAVMGARLVLGTHHVGDLLGGLLVGGALLALARRAWPRVVRWCERRGPRFFISMSVGAVVTAAVATVGFSGAYRAWQLLGAGAGAALGILWDAYRGGEPSRAVPYRVPGPAVALGLAVLLALTAASELLREGPPWAHALLYLGAMLWGSWLVPAWARVHAPRALTAGAAGPAPTGRCAAAGRARR